MSADDCSRTGASARASHSRPTTPGIAGSLREAAIDVVEQACRLCVDVKKALFSGYGRILEKTDQTAVIVADFGVQALVSLELGNLFPSIPLVAEEDSASISSTDLVGYVVDAVTDQASSEASLVLGSGSNRWDMRISKRKGVLVCGRIGTCSWWRSCIRCNGMP
ncbi:hypothetical protein NL676_007880 [Syzygium grande]|nr:hypothetical protein NL676_007880 [Syzygium grande]